jgi:hypothetical protein
LFVVADAFGAIFIVISIVIIIIMAADDLTLGAKTRATVSSQAHSIGLCL